MNKTYIAIFVAMMGNCHHESGVVTIELDNTRNKVNDLEKEISQLKSKLAEKEQAVFNMEFNTALVKNWKDSDGNEFTGRIYWTKHSGSLQHRYGEYFEGKWDIKGNIIKGELSDHGCVIEKWKTC
jgi:hypothetical protein